jgi:hypothetical protein
MPSKKDYDNCADFSKANYISITTLQILRYSFTAMLLVNCLTTYLANPDGVMHLVYFFSYWGTTFTMAGLALSIKASVDEAGRKRF